MSDKIVFFGNERLATGVTTDVVVLRALIAASYDIRAVVSHNEDTRSRKPRPLEIADVAQQHSIPVLLPHKMAEVIEDLRSFDADVGVLVAFGKIVPQAIIDLFPRGIVNIHPSALPKHRGPTPLESVILAGETETAVTLMQLEAAMDAGPVYAQQPVSLTGSETKQQLADTLLALGRDLLIEHLPGILNGSLVPTDQDDSEATYDALITKQDAFIDWHQPAVVIERQIRAYAGWPKSRASVGGHDVVVLAARIAPSQGLPVGTARVWNGNGELGVETGDGFLVIDELLPLGKRPMSGDAFLRGYSLD